MKVLTVEHPYGDDYAALCFEDSGLDTLEVWKECDAAGGKLEKEVHNEDMDAEFLFRSYEFDEVPQPFIQLMRDMQDYDSTKHQNWYVCS